LFHGTPKRLYLILPRSEADGWYYRRPAPALAGRQPRTAGP